MGKLIDLTGKKFGRLTVIRRSEYKGNSKFSQHVYWDCLCDCGGITAVEGWALRNGKVNSCGCLYFEAITKHGHHKEKLYKVWSTMKSRCNNPKDKNAMYYHDKGIRVCDEWDCSYKNFRDWANQSGYMEGLTIDRIDSSKNYSPENCRWITKSENSKRAGEKILTVNGISKSRVEWERYLKIGRNRVSHWISRRGEEYAIKRIDSILNPEKYTEEELFYPSHYERKYLTIDGVTLTRGTWSKKIGHSSNIVTSWIKKYGEEKTIEKIRNALSGGE